jgi:hypothetical protein
VAEPVWTRLAGHGALDADRRDPAVSEGSDHPRAQGNVAAEVAAAVARLGRPWWKRLIRQVAIPLIGAAILAIAYTSWLGYQHWLTGREVSTLLEAGRLQHQSG